VNDELRAEVTDNFCELTGLPEIERLVQRGRDPATARFTMHLTDGNRVTVGTIETLWSQAKLAKVMAVTTGRIVRACKPADWRNAIGALIMHATDVEEAPEEALSDRTLDWLEQYLAGAATADRDGAVDRREPFTDSGDVWVHVEHFARWLRREYSEQVAVSDLRLALVDLGFTSDRVQYNANGSGATRKRTTARYFRAATADLDLADQRP
jgi:hypothetical protein